MTELELHEHWNYYLSLENDLSDTSRYVEPAGQENVHSFEFAKILILACTEAETVFRNLCVEITNTSVPTNMGDYKHIILARFPKIVDATVRIRRLNKNLNPFSGWDVGKLSWWDAYQGVKHDRGKTFDDATYHNAVYAIAALYILIFYLNEVSKLNCYLSGNSYVTSGYQGPTLVAAPSEKLPGF